MYCSQFSHPETVPGNLPLCLWKKRNTLSAPRIINNVKVSIVQTHEYSLAWSWAFVTFSSWLRCWAKQTFSSILCAYIRGLNNRLCNCHSCKYSFHFIWEITFSKTKTKVMVILWLYSWNMLVEIAGKCSCGWPKLVYLLRGNSEGSTCQLQPAEDLTRCWCSQ